MEFRNVKHKGLKRFLERDDSSKLPPDSVSKIGDILSFLIAMGEIKEFYDIEKYKPHTLKGDRKGTYALWVTGNWRITFGFDAEKNELFDLHYEDYHEK